MIRYGNEFDRPLLSDRNKRRLEAMGVSVVSFLEDGTVLVPGEIRPLERIIVSSPSFAAEIRPRLDAMRRYIGQTFAIWPGLTLVSLPTRAGRWLAPAAPHPVLAALLLGPELFNTPALRAIAAHAGAEPHELHALGDPRALLGQAEMDRLARAIVWMQMDGVEVDRRCDELRHMSQELGECYEELSLLYRLTTNMSVGRPSAEFIRDACQELQQVAGLRWIAFQLQDDEPRLEDLVGQLFTAGEVGCDRFTLKMIAANLMRRFRDACDPLVIDDTQSLEFEPLSRIARQLLVIPLVREGSLLGILFGGDKLDQSNISSVDAKLCHALANSLSIFLENSLLFEDMQAMFLGTLHALTTSIDAKDRYTRGHSERVALMSRSLAQAAALDPRQVERIYLAALIHDLGKIGVPEAVLAKPGKLTADEFELIKQHPEIGARIIAAIRPMKDLVPGVLHHHERYDGRGYPYGLSGETIPLMGRILCLADAFDAMSSDRSYRNPMPHNQVLTEIQTHAGAQFDPRLADLFVRLDFTEFFELIREHRDQGVSRTKIA